jgi:transcriptional regulator PpsR
LDGLAPEETARILAASGDVTVVLDGDGVVRDIAVGSSELGGDPFAGWIDRPFVETVSQDSRGKVEEMLQDAASRVSPRWRQVNHPAKGSQVPVRYLALEAGRNGRVIAIGRDMRTAQQLQQRLIQAQQSMERDYLRLRQTEQRYRLLFDLTPEPVLIVDLGTRRITEANPAAQALAGVRSGDLMGRGYLELFDPNSRDDALEMLGAVAGGASQLPLRLRLASGREALVSAALFRQDRSAHLLVRLNLDSREAPAPEGEALAAVLERIPDAFLLTDRHFVIEAANPAFLDLTQTPRLEQVIGVPLARFLARPETDLDLIQAQLKANGQLRNFDTLLRDRLGDRVEAELTAVSVERRGEPHVGLAIRPAGRRIDAVSADPAGMPRSVEQLTELVGRVSLKDIVRESTDLIERLCIEAALRHTSNNRASAAEVLGLSRQSLYSKLHRHGMSGPLADSDDEQEN